MWSDGHVEHLSEVRLVSISSLEGWFSDHHPNLAGYRVIADETVKFPVPIMRARSRKDRSSN